MAAILFRSQCVKHEMPTMNSLAPHTHIPRKFALWRPGSLYDSAIDIHELIGKQVP